VPGSVQRLKTRRPQARFCQESHEGCWSKNRRGHFVITGKCGSPAFAVSGSFGQRIRRGPDTRALRKQNIVVVRSRLVFLSTGGCVFRFRRHHSEAGSTVRRVAISPDLDTVPVASSCRPEAVRRAVALVTHSVCRAHLVRDGCPSDRLPIIRNVRCGWTSASGCTTRTHGPTQLYGVGDWPSARCTQRCYCLDLSLLRVWRGLGPSSPPSFTVIDFTAGTGKGRRIRVARSAFRQPVWARTTHPSRTLCGSNGSASQEMTPRRTA
jgi:hypothetical protein